MLARQEGPTARRDEARNWIFTNDVMIAYKNDLDDDEVVGRKFQFFNGPYGGGRKFEIVQITDDAVIAREI